ncbi:hypothetical protein D1641_18730, partial [Colidextribacter sp. OB.20]|uniref:hypothetical protein n=1 Tax=Colidextribacter sp. OB.20 TaxID=2304568 RepID=UPI00139EA73A
MRNLNRKGGERQRGWIERPAEKAKTPEQHKAVRALGLAIWADKKRLFSQTWVGDAAAEIRLFLTSTYLFVIAWRHPPVAAKTQKSGGFRFLNRPLSSRQMKKRKLGHEGL